MKRLLFLIFASVLLLGCTQASAPSATPTEIVTSTPTPSATAAPTADAQVATATPDPWQSMNESDYAQLKNMCKDDTCCLGSLETMKKARGVFTREGVCPEGSQLNTVKCPSAYQWCEPVASEEPKVAMANPASVHCAQLGFSETFSNGESACVFTDGTSCEPWAFLRGKCGTQYSACAKAAGFLIPVTEGEENETRFEYGQCIFGDVSDRPDNLERNQSQCEEGELAAGTCKPGQCKTWSIQNGCEN